MPLPKGNLMQFTIIRFIFPFVKPFLKNNYIFFRNVKKGGKRSAEPGKKKSGAEIFILSRFLYG